MSVTAWTVIGLLWVIVLALAATVLALARQIGVLHERIRPVGALKLAQGLKVGEAAPVVEVEDIRGGTLRLGAPHPDNRDTLVVFVAPGCPVCKSLLPALRAIRRTENARTDVVLASDGARLEHLEFVAAESLDEFPYVLSERLGMSYGVGRLPYAVLIDGSGTVRAAGLVNTREHLDSLFEARERGVGSLQEFLSAQRREVA